MARRRKDSVEVTLATADVLNWRIVVIAECELMFSRPLLFVGVLAAAVAVPYVMTEEHLADTARGLFERFWKKSPPNAALLGDMPEAGGLAGANVMNASSAPAASIEEVFRFNVSPQWVIGRWPRVTTVAGDPDQLGMRVALVTGTRADDVAGSLTYFFDEHHRLQRITFTGQTGDARRLLATVVTANGLKSLPTTDAAHYVAGDPDDPSSEVTVRHVPVVRAAAEHNRLDVAIDLHRDDVEGWEKRAADEVEPSFVPSSYRRW